jgi:hypothetical protein
VAKHIARLIKTSRKNKAALAAESMEELPAEELKTHAFIGATFCESPGNIPKFLRLVADILEGREPYNPGNDWYDKAIKAAYKEACRRHRPYVPPGFEDIKEYIFSRPSFSEFRDIFEKQNPASKLARPPSDRSLRRSLQRLGCMLFPDKRGRPKQK